jgi:hypothetical protein
MRIPSRFGGEAELDNVDSRVIAKEQPDRLRPKRRTLDHDFAANQRISDPPFDVANHTSAQYNRMLDLATQ